MGRSRYTFGEAAYPHFLTCTVVGWLPVFTRPETVSVVLDSWRFLQDEGRLTLLGYVILENHLHCIAAGDDLAAAIAAFKSFTARRIIDLLRERQVRPLLDQLAYQRARHKADRAYQFWQEGSHPKVITAEVVLRQKLEYIHNNPVERGFVDDPTHRRYSSARNYAGREGLIPVTTDW